MCKERGLIDNIDFFNKEYYQSQIDNMINSESYTQILDSLNKRLETRTSGPPTYPPDPGMFPLVAYFAVLVAVSAVAAIGIAIVLLEAVEGPKNMSANPVGESVVNLWILKEGNDSLLNFDDEINRCIDSVIDFIKSEKPSYFNTLSEDYIREILKYNFINRR